MEILSPAKLNLFLAVTGKKPDGFHELITLFCRVGLYDHIRLDFGSTDISVSCNHPDVPEDEKNIAYQAAALYFAWINRKTNIPLQGINISIKKNIPVGAGLGGGSSNAASVLMSLNELCRFPFSKMELMEMGLALGADVPFFIFKNPALAHGIGEKLSIYRKLKPYHVVLVNPGIHISTQEVYKNLNLGLTKCAQKLNCFLFKNETFRPNHHMCNDLEMVTGSLCDDIFLIKDKLLAFGAQGALMTGSGPTVFGLFKDKEIARQAYNRLWKNKDWTVFIAELLT